MISAFPNFLLYLLIPCMLGRGTHPVHISVLSIEHNSAEKTLEISCRVLSIDMENYLRSTTRQKVDLLNPKYKGAMDTLLFDCLQKHIEISADERRVNLKYVGYEQDEDGLMIYLQADSVLQPGKLEITNNLLYEYKPEQVSLIHATVGGVRKSTKLNNPADKAVFLF